MDTVSQSINQTNNRWIMAQIEYDSRKMSKEQIEENIKAGRVGFNHPMFDKYRAKQKEQDDYIVNPCEVEEGVVSCPKCHQNFVFSTVKQTRAADEPMTTVAYCVKCKHSWSYNG